MPQQITEFTLLMSSLSYENKLVSCKQINASLAQTVAFYSQLVCS